MDVNRLATFSIQSVSQYLISKCPLPQYAPSHEKDGSSTAEREPNSTSSLFDVTSDVTFSAAK